MLEIKNLHKHYGKVAALDGVDLTVAKGETVVVMGFRLREIYSDSLCKSFDRTGSGGLSHFCRPRCFAPKQWGNCKT